MATTKQKRYNRRGWHALSDDLRINRAGHGFVRMRECGSALPLADVRPDPKTRTATPADSVNSEFVERPFRMLSKVLIEGHWVDFSEGDVLKSALPLFADLTIYPDHNPSVKEWLGLAVSPVWTDSLGVPGIDANFRVDSVSNPKIARGLQLEPPAVKACSVGIYFKYRRSHPDMSDWQFYEMLGRQIDSEVVRFVVTEITRVVEVSLVYAGADRNAVMLSVDDEFTETEEDDTMPEEADLRPLKDRIAQLESDLNTSAAAVLSRDTELESFRALGTIEQLKEAVQFRTAELERVRSAAEKAYRLARKDRVEERIISMIQSADLEGARAFAAEFGAELESVHPARCHDCGSTNLTRASGQEPHAPGMKDDLIFIPKK